MPKRPSCTILGRSDGSEFYRLPFRRYAVARARLNFGRPLRRDAFVLPLLRENRRSVAARIVGSCVADGYRNKKTCPLQERSGTPRSPSPQPSTIRFVSLAANCRYLSRVVSGERFQTTCLRSTALAAVCSLIAVPKKCDNSVVPWNFRRGFRRLSRLGSLYVSYAGCLTTAKLGSRLCAKNSKIN